MDKSSGNKTDKVDELHSATDDSEERLQLKGTPQAKWFSTICDAVKEAAKKTLPSKSTAATTKRKVSDNTKALYNEKRRLQQKPGAAKKDFRKIHKKIKNSCLND